MSNSRRLLLKGVLALAMCVSSACTLYVVRAESAYHDGRYLEVAEQLAAREPEVKQLRQAEKARYGLYRGLALIKLGQYGDAKRWLGYAREQEGRGASLSALQRRQLDLGWATLARMLPVVATPPASSVTTDSAAPSSAAADTPPAP
jgi:hypothetical protein